MPIWIQVLQALLTPAIAIGVGVIAYMQWRTAHQKVVLDLFARRIAIVEMVETAVDSIYENKEFGDDTEKLLHDCVRRARYLFGADVMEYLKSLWFLAQDLKRHCVSLSVTEPGPKRDAIDSDRNRVLRAIFHAHREETVFFSYIRMDQKLVLTPLQWLVERNKIRLSYADDKQR
ncbi:hypothetical protein HF265_00495 [Rhizobium leguminosarum]|uniref:hypothetical protein n=1 Tax=Rhizobium leguminosarum TaxID=384 RepID=UPI001C91E5CA|nr:hypothetical protein [Rhizobium leguminosarum]MBY3027599.1 hypothetical protein [Rhizobium leguminosarum]